jgi:hypothetical protein
VRLQANGNLLKARLSFLILKRQDGGASDSFGSTSLSAPLLLVIPSVLDLPTENLKDLLESHSRLLQDFIHRPEMK